MIGTESSSEIRLNEKPVAKNGPTPAGSCVLTIRHTDPALSYVVLLARNPALATKVLSTPRDRADKKLLGPRLIPASARLFIV